MTPITIQVVNIDEITSADFIKRLAREVAAELRAQDESESTEFFTDREVKETKCRELPEIAPKKGDVFCDDRGEVRIMAYVDFYVMARRPGCVPFVERVTSFQKKFTFKCDKNGRNEDEQYAHARKGCVYLLQSHELFKIGRTRNPHLRLAEIQCANPHVELVHIFDCVDMERTERQLHDKFRYKRKDGEWFELSEKDVEYILRIKAL